MYKSNLFADVNQAKKDTLKNQSCSNDNIFDHQKFPSLSRINEYTNSLSSLLEKKTSFAQFISDETYNLRFFHSFKGTREITDNRNDEKKLIRNFHSLPYDVLDNYYLALTDAEVVHDEEAETSMTHSANIAVGTLSTVSTIKRTQYIRDILAHKPIDINNINRKRHMRYVEPRVNCLNNEQTKAARCFILQLNTYIHQKMLTSQKQPYVQYKKLDVLSEELIELETNTTLKSYTNDPHLAETNDSIDISMQLSDNLETTLNENDVLLTFYNQPIINNIFNSTANNIETNNSYGLVKQLTMLNSSTTKTNSNSSIDLRNLLSELNETKSSIPLHSRCSVAFEFADREQHLVEVIELPRSSHRMARLNIYKQIHKRLAVENLIDIDLTALLRTILQ